MRDEDENKKEVRNKTKERRTRPDHNDGNEDDDKRVKKANTRMPFSHFDLNKLILQIEEN